MIKDVQHCEYHENQKEIIGSFSMPITNLAFLGMGVQTFK